MELMNKAQSFLAEVRAEAYKVSWPSRDEVRQSTIVVILAVWIMAAFIFVVDWILNQGAQAIL
jgi:preprotein translocase subunit SecE